MCSSALFVTSALEGVRGQRHTPAVPYPWERPGTHCTGGWVRLRAGLDRCGKSRPTGMFYFYSILLYSVLTLRIYMSE